MSAAVTPVIVMVPFTVQWPVLLEGWVADGALLGAPDDASVGELVGAKVVALDGDPGSVLLGAPDGARVGELVGGVGA